MHTGPNEVKVSLSDGGEQTINTKNIMIATGSDSSSVPGLEIDEKKCATYTSCFHMYVSCWCGLEFGVASKSIIHCTVGSLLLRDAAKTRPYWL